MIYAIGELLTEFVSHKTGCGLESTTEFSGPFPSGAPAIFADQVARVGGQVSMIGTVGDDPFGRLILHRLASDGVDTSLVGTSASLTTGTAFASYYADGSRVFVFHLEGTAADNIDAPTDLPEGSLLHISGASLGNSKIRAAIHYLVGNVRVRCRISYDPNIRAELLGDRKAKSTIDMLIDHCDYFLPSDADVETLFPGKSAEWVIEDQLASGKRAVVVKQGDQGVVASDGNTTLRLPAVPVDELDPTGAGDCFCGAFLGLLDQGWRFEDALRAANIAGAMHVSKRGPMEWNPALADIQKRLAPQEG